MSKKAYYCEDDYSGYCKIGYFDTRNQAKNYFAGEFSLRYIDVKPYRLPWADIYEDVDNIPIEAYFENGWWFECNYCGSYIHELADFFNVKEGKGYCCKSCYENKVMELIK